MLTWTKDKDLDQQCLVRRFHRIDSKHTKELIWPHKYILINFLVSYHIRCCVLCAAHHIFRFAWTQWLFSMNCPHYFSSPTPTLTVRSATYCNLDNKVKIVRRGSRFCWISMAKLQLLQYHSLWTGSRAIKPLLLQHPLLAYKVWEILPKETLSNFKTH